MVERLYPGVYVTEVPCQPKTIAGVSTSTAPLHPLHAEHAARVPSSAPDWTDRNDSDPGITLVQLAAWLNELMLFAAPAHPASRARYMPTGWGVAEGLAVDDGGSGGSSHLKVTPGSAFTAEGRPIAAESTTVALRVRKP